MTTDDISASRQIDAIIDQAEAWKANLLSRLRALIKEADPDVVEQVKWKKPSQPEGIPVWDHGGNLCFANILKNAVRLTFPKGARMKDPNGLFNTRLDSATVRAIDLEEGAAVDEAGLKALIREAVALNA